MLKTWLKQLYIATVAKQWLAKQGFELVSLGMLTVPTEFQTVNYLLSWIFFSLKRWWKSFNSLISPKDSISSTRLSSLSSKTSRGKRMTTRGKKKGHHNLWFWIINTGRRDSSYHACWSGARRCRDLRNVKDRQDHLPHLGLSAPSAEDCAWVLSPGKPEDSCQSNQSLFNGIINA